MTEELTPLSTGAVWTLICAGLVLLMTPGLAFFYGGMTRAKAALNMMMMSFVSMGLIGVVWILWGHSMSEGPGLFGILGNPFADVGLTAELGTDGLVAAGFSATFAIITVALISGAVADRAKFSTWCVFVPIWVTLVYCPLALMVWGGGLLSADGAVGQLVGEAVDFAGGLVVHTAAGTAALVLAVMLGRRAGFGVDPSHRAHNLPLVMLGAAVLWFGWFGFNGGAAEDIETAGLIWVNTLAAPAAGMLGWLLVDRVRGQRPSTMGTASGIVAGLVAITPACAYVTPLGALLIGLVAGAAAAAAVTWKFRLGLDDSLDVVGVHLVAGVVGTLMIGLLAVPLEDGRAGLFMGGDAALLLAQTVAVIVAIVFTAAMTALIAGVLAPVMGLRVSAEEEERGVDESAHAESAYAFTGDWAQAPLAEDSETPAGQR
ncbi:MAG: ammonium transporter [Micrococcus sp.]|nr:ammonium transporter [Micrococcus sp.]